ncbi:IPT/TIG domain-containing protein [Geobacter sp. DSM 9736]|uniref:IPT/TIG domain-containing protein n=1 Tax=Geobacter sp. DSM 9736 TaxID=1277350 RepID=UPI000B50204D|nr:IPT/TIG domain-containing protein [Geobacter sp. DSM 9736]SNB46399.1 IPT/TIG domain-containing protein [Geobacter sp. DSM 9736]
MQWRWLLIIPALLAATSAAVTGQTPSQRSAGTKERPAAINILSIIPAQGVPGITVTLYGSGFTDTTVAFLGNQEVPTTVVGPKQLTFEIPRLAPGLYALFLKRGDGSTSKIYNFTLLPQKPVAAELSPDRIDLCATGRDREVTVSGQNFQERSQVLFDGAAIRGRFISDTSLAFTVPNVPPGLHQVQVKNVEETTSGALALMILGTPEIDSIFPGEERVNSYDLIIQGRNFQQGSVVVVMEENSLDPGAPAGALTKRLGSAGVSGTGERERIIYVNCNRIIYQRYPYSTALKNFRVQVVNPSGEESAPMSVSAP